MKKRAWVLPQAAMLAPISPSYNAFKSVVLPTAVTLMLCNMDRICMSVAIMPIAAEFAWPASMQGIIQSAFLWGYTATQFLGGYLADKFGGKTVMACGVVWFSVASLLLPVALSHPVADAGLTIQSVFVARCLVGLGEGVAMPSMNNLVAAHIPLKSRASALGLTYSGFHCGNLLGLLLSPILLLQFGWRSLFLIFGLLGVPLLVMWMSTVPASAPNVGTDRAAAPSASLTSSMPLSSVTAHAAGLSPPSLSMPHKAPDTAPQVVLHDAIKELEAQEADVQVSWDEVYSLELSSNGPPDTSHTATSTAGRELVRTQSQIDSERSDLSDEPWFITAVNNAVHQTSSPPHSGDAEQWKPSGVDEALSVSSSPSSVSLSQLLSSSATWAIVIVNMVQNWGYFIFMNWMPTYFNTVLGFDIHSSSFLSFLPFLVVACVGNVAGILADYCLLKGVSVLVIRKSMQTVAFLIPAVALLVLAQPGLSPGVAVAAMTVALGTTSLGQAGFVANMSDIAPRHAGKMFGLCNTFGSLSGIIGVTAVGFIVEATKSFSTVFLMTAGMYIAATIAWNLLCRAEVVFH
ncbi:hypothetical protein CEUSTIGMA_g10385.t1 [Chlamydomonas eustigma]|uniref:Major facilitator superfamily (MFS) profile domain-containing protein n=1 Tax=Chlamydomonas eustigma TaxID=1157962 RepID=A0A250XIQ1_9CHLO|nr:hypothetical protein CEUSTIGMA_g10385.t1 [Chlamydomonas eustigma]|eukprot:GAX82958.1 hypothetical protein CEUSTIGMA_g10385.t1 [Chlamydomonas eustigma]